MINIFYNKDFIKIRLCLGLSSKSHRKQMSRQQDCSVLFVTFEIAKRLSKNVQSYRNSRKTSCSDR